MPVFTRCFFWLFWFWPDDLVWVCFFQWYTLRVSNDRWQTPNTRLSSWRSAKDRLKLKVSHTRPSLWHRVRNTQACVRTAQAQLESKRCLGDRGRKHSTINPYAGETFFDFGFEWYTLRASNDRRQSLCTRCSSWLSAKEKQKLKVSHTRSSVWHRVRNTQVCVYIIQASH